MIFMIQKYEISNNLLIQIIAKISNYLRNKMASLFGRVPEHSAAESNNVATVQNGEQQDQKLSQEQIDGLIEEANKMKELLEGFESQFKEHSQEFFYVLEMKWLKRWKHFVQYDLVTSGHDFDPEAIGQVRLPKINEGIVETQPYLLKYPEKEHPCNIVMKSNLVENEDYIFVTGDTWNYLNSKYNGITIQRRCLILPDGTRKIEIDLLKIKIVPISNQTLRAIDHDKIQKLPCWLLQVFPDTKIDDLHQIFYGLLKTQEGKRLFEFSFYWGIDGNDDNIRIWKLDPEIGPLENTFELLKTICKENKSYEYTINFKGNFVSKFPESKIQDLDISETDHLVVEARENSYNWSFIGDGVTKYEKCDNCIKYKQITVKCGCNQVGYCTQTCLEKDRRFHSLRCARAREEAENKLIDIKPTSSSMWGSVGLSNLGNTCFMNGGLQCLVNLKELTEYFLTNKYKQEINDTNPLGTHGKLAKQYAIVCKNIWFGTTSQFSPNNFKRALSDFAPMFTGYQQHDSQEFIAYLVDGLHEDLNRVKSKEATGSIEDEKLSDAEIAFKSWENHLKRNQSIIVDLMHGQYKSKITCPQCNRISWTFDPFNCVPLPIPFIKKKEIELFFLFANNMKKPIKVKIEFQKNGHTVNRLKEEVSKIAGVDSETFDLWLLTHSTSEKVSEVEETRLVRKKLKHKNLFAITLSDEEKAIENGCHIFFSPCKEQILYGEAKYKSISFLRPIFVPKKASMREIYFDAFKNFRFLFNLNWPDSSSSPTQNQMTNEEAFEQIFFQKKFDPFKIRFVNREIFTPCTLCGKTKCDNCDIPIDSDITIEHILSKLTEELVLEVCFDAPIDLVDLTKMNDYQEKQSESLLTEDNNQKKSSETKEQTINIYDCFKEFEVPEKLAEDNTWYCNVCKAHQQATKVMAIYKSPPILVVQLKRFKGGKKLGCLVDFPTKGLDITDFIINKEPPSEYPIQKIAPNINQEDVIETDIPNGNGIENDGHVVDEVTEKDDDLSEENTDKENTIKENEPIIQKADENASKNTDDPERITYDLCGVVNHFGSLSFGHYTAHVYNFKRKTWLYCDDSHVREEKESDVCTEAAYVLFYRKRGYVHPY